MRRLSHIAAEPGARAPRGAAAKAAGGAREAAAAARETVGGAIDRCARALRRARVHFGHGTDNARDEAAELVFFAAGLEHELGANAYAKPLTARRIARIDGLLERRIAARLPLAYLTHRAFFAGLELYVDERVLVPRSPIAELVMQRFEPWVDARRVRRILDVGTGSGAIALACATAFPGAAVDAVDVSARALQVARRNLRRLGLQKRVRMLQSNYFDAVGGCHYDIIVSNPPYVGLAELRRLPREYGHEPRLGLAAGADGLDSVRAIFAGARRHLSRNGILVVEVGNTEKTLQRAFPRLPFVWPEIAMGGGGVFLLQARDLEEGRTEAGAAASGGRYGGRGRRSVAGRPVR
jgi:ribosomal protein L3 glutamine methyltransferase